MKYAAFGGQTYYPSGGWGDLLETSNNLEYLKDRKSHFKNTVYINWYHIVDLETLKIVSGPADAWTDDPECYGVGTGPI